LKVRSIKIERFRGIRSFDWKLSAPFVCLVGAGDSTKTSILDALGLALSSRYNVSFVDADFYDCDTASPIIIEVALCDLPDTLVQERSHGKNRSGIRSDGSFEHDPLDDEDVAECLIIRLSVDQTLEPVWEVVRPGEESGVRITAGERAQLGFFRMGEYADAHLRWSRGSALTSLTASRTDASYAVVEAQRRARQAVASLAGTPLHEAALIAQAEAKRLGSCAFVDLRPGLDPNLTASTAALVLHEGKVPLTQYGLGSRRLTGLAIQENATAERSIVAIDEVEHGLEPHRLLHLVRYLRLQAAAGDLQVFVTTHSPVVVESLQTAELFVIKSEAGTTTVTPVPPELSHQDLDTTQGVIRKRPSALLARRIIVGEGATETGLLRYLLGAWDAERKKPDDLTAVTAGVTVMNGEGDAQAPARAKALARLGYPTLLLLDGDVTSNAEQVRQASDAGVEVVQWSSGKALEDIVVTSLPQAALQAFVELAADENSEEGVLSGVAARLGVANLATLDVYDWVAQHGIAAVREAIAAAAKGKKLTGDKKDESKAWFKREDRGERLGQLLLASRSDVVDTELAIKLGWVKMFAYLEAPEPVAGANPPSPQPLAEIV
jgi:hypothetical protein